MATQKSTKSKADQQANKPPTGVGLARGATGDKVVNLQRYLQQFGYLNQALPADHPYARTRDLAAAASEDGSFDQATEEALRNYQQFQGLRVTGKLDRATIQQMKLPRCGFPDTPVGIVAGAKFVVQGNRWTTTNLRYRFVNFTPDLQQAQVRNAVVSAFNLWSAVTPLNFAEVTGSADAEILVWFVAGDHNDGSPFDGPSGVLAHAYYPPPNGGAIAGDAHFDEAETWSVNSPPSGFDLVSVAAHEFGHSLGLNHSSVGNSLMFPTYSGLHRFLHRDDLDGIRGIYGVRTTGVKPVPGWFGAQDQGADVALSDISGNGTPDLVVFHIDNPGGENHGYYRIGWNLNGNGDATGGWSAVKPVPGWFGAEDQGAGIALGDINGNGRPDLVVFHIDNPGGENHGYYRVGWNLNVNGDVTGGWSNVKPVPGWFGAENQGAGIALADINGNGTPDLVVFHIDNPGGENHGYYRIGWNLNANGDVTGGWSAVKPVPGWFGAEDQGAGIALGDVDGDGRPDLVVFHLDNPGGENHGYYRIGYKLDAAGNVTGGWGPVIQIPGWFGAEDQGAGIAVGAIGGGAGLDLVVFHVDNPGGENHGYYRVAWNI
jgi:predicted Zn-dependent protease